MTDKFKAIELLGKNIDLFTPKQAPEVERSEVEIISEIRKKLEVLVD